MSGCWIADDGRFAYVLMESFVCCRLLVGAPRAKALSGQKAKVTGGLYSCDMSSPDCSRVIFDDSGEISAHTCALPTCFWLFQTFYSNISVTITSLCLFWSLSLCRGYSQRKQREPVDGSVSQQSGTRRQDYGKSVCLCI